MILGVVLASLVGGTVYVLAQSATSERQEEVTKALKVVALVPERTLIPPTSLQVVDVPARLKPTNALTKVEEAANKMATTNLYPGDWVLRDRVVDTKGQVGSSFTLEPGHVMITFPPSDIIGTGAVVPGDSVDLLVTIDTSKEGGASPVPGAAGQASGPGGTTQLTMQNLKILNIGSVPKAKSGGEAAQPPSGQAGQIITFSVPREDALVLKQLKDYPGIKIDMVLRQAGDTQMYSTEAVNMRGLIERFQIQAP